MWEKEKLLVTSNFSFSHSVFKRLVLQTRKNQGLFGKGLNNLNGQVHLMVQSVTGQSRFFESIIMNLLDIMHYGDVQDIRKVWVHG